MARCRAQIPNANTQTPKNIPIFEAGAIRTAGIPLKFLWDLIIGVCDFYSLPL
jgi:hypothetical protein